MRSWLIVLCFWCLGSNARGGFLPNVFHQLLQHLSISSQYNSTAISQGVAIPAAHHLIRDLYKGAQSLRSRPYLSLQKLLQAHDDERNDANEGTIYMGSTAGHLIPVDFTLSSAICPLGTDALLLAHELTSWVLFAHASGTKSSDLTIEESVKLSKTEGEYRATLSLTIGAEIEGGPFLGLMKLLAKTTEALFTETGEAGFGTLSQRATFEGVEFEASWTWYEVVDGVGRCCES